MEMIAGHLDQHDLDELTLDHDALAISYRASMALRASLVAHYLGTVLSEHAGEHGIDLSSIAACEPIGL